MSAAASATALFDLKSTAWTLTALRLQSADVPALAAALDARFAGSPGLFDGEGVAIDLAALREALVTQGWTAADATTVAAARPSFTTYVALQNTWKELG